MARSCNGRVRLGVRARFFAGRVAKCWNRISMEAITTLSLLEFRKWLLNLGSTLSALSDFWVFLCGARSWARWSSWVTSNSGYSMIMYYSKGGNWHLSSCRLANPLLGQPFLWSQLKMWSIKNRKLWRTDWSRQIWSATSQRSIRTSYHLWVLLFSKWQKNGLFM